MANITIRKDNTNKAEPTATWEHPFRMMRDLMGWDPFREMSSLVPQLPSGFAPSFEIKETKDGFVFKADVPGIRENDLDVTITGNRLAISGKREAEKQEQTDTYYAFERSYGEFARSFTLPEGIDANSVRADLKDGVLTVSIQKTREAQPKKIEVQAAAKKS